MKDWYRKTSWTEIDEKEFFLKLRRARKINQAQYLRVQAVTLVETKDEKLMTVAEILLHKMLKEYPENKIEKSSALDILGEIYEQMENYETAINYYKQAIDFEKEFPLAISDAYLSYAVLVVKMHRADLYNELENIILERYSTLLFPIDKYKANSVLAITNKYKGNLKEANYYADLADQNAILETSGLRYHKYLAIVKERDTWLDSLIKHE